MTDSKYTINAERLRQAMAEKGMRASELSNLTGIGKSSISHYLSGAHWPDDNRKVGKMADALEVNPHWLMGFDVQKHTDKSSADGNSEQPVYYTDDTTATLAEEMALNPELRALFDVQKDMDPDDLKALYGMALALKRKSERLDSDDPA